MSRIFLIGPMGAGKTSIGRRLSCLLHVNFIDFDQLFEEQLQQTVAAFFTAFGEKKFRKLEQEILDQATDHDNIVLATGGGSILCESTRLQLQARGMVCYLKVSPEQQLQRLMDDVHRPLLPAAALRFLFFTQMLAERGYLYESIADIIIDTDNRTIGDLSNQLAHEVSSTCLNIFTKAIGVNA